MFNHLLFGQVMELVHLDPYYKKVPTGSHTNSLYYAVKYNKCIPHYKENTLLGFCTYGFFNQEELDRGVWSGEEVYSRDSGGVLHFPKFQCRAGRKEVVRFIRDIQAFLSLTYPNLKDAGGLRVYPDGRTREEKWYRKST